MIYQWNAGGGDPEKVVGDFYGCLADGSPRPVDPFAERLFLGVVQRSAELDAIIKRHANNWSLERMSVVVRQVLRLAVSELRSRRTPPRVVINEALDISRRFAGDEPSAFVNGVLEAARRELDREPASQPAGQGTE